MDESPLLGTSFFDSRTFSKKLLDRLEIPDLHIEEKQTKWVSTDDLFKGLGENIEYIPFTLSPIETEAFWVMSQEDIEKICTFFLTKDEKHKGFTSQILQEGYYHYLLLETFDILKEMPLFDHLSPKLHFDAPKPSLPALVKDIEIKFKNFVCWGKLIFPSSFQKSWKTYFHKLLPDPVHPEIARNCTLTVGLKIGEITLTENEISSLKAGDFVLFEHSSYDIKTKQGSAVLTLNTHSLLQVSIQDNQCVTTAPLDQEKKNMEKTDNLDQPLEPEENLVSSVEEEENTDLKSLPINLCIEIARFKISLKKLMSLEPGNVLELPIHPNQAASLTVNGKKMGSAELIYLGENLGIRILDLGK